MNTFRKHLKPRWKIFTNYLNGATLRGGRQFSWDAGLHHLLQLIRNTDFFFKERRDEWIWTKNSSKNISIKSVYEVLVKPLIQKDDFHWNTVWIKNLIPKVNCFWWVVVHGKIVTFDKAIFICPVNASCVIMLRSLSCICFYFIPIQGKFCLSSLRTWWLNRFSLLMLRCLWIVRMCLLFLTILLWICGNKSLPLLIGDFGRNGIIESLGTLLGTKI